MSLSAFGTPRTFVTRAALSENFGQPEETIHCTICGDAWQPREGICDLCAHRGPELLDAILSDLRVPDARGKDLSVSESIAQFLVAIKRWEMRQPRWCGECYFEAPDIHFNLKPWALCRRCDDRHSLKLEVRDMLESVGVLVDALREIA